MSMSEKLALFNKLSLPGRLGANSADGPPERRRQKGARYRTQPITVEEVSLVSKKNQSRNNNRTAAVIMFLHVIFMFLWTSYPSLAPERPHPASCLLFVA